MPNSTKLLLVGWCVTCLALAGCGGDEARCGEGHDEVPNIIDDDTDLDTFWVGSVGLDELHVLGSGAEHDTLIQANFSDFSNYMVQLADRIDFSTACFIYTSRPITSGDPIPLTVTRVTFGGLSAGDTVLEPDANDRLPPQVLDGRVFTGAPLTISVESAGGATDFPVLQEQLPAPAAPLLTRLGDLAPVDLGAAPSLDITSQRGVPLQVEWEPGEGDYVEVKILPGAGSTTEYQKLRCITFDDGCLEIPAAALNHLALDEATNFRFRIERHQFVLHSIKEGATTKAAALIDASSTLEGLVLR